MIVINTQQHTSTSLIAEPFGDDGAVRLVPVDGDRPGRAVILDALAASELAAFLTNLNS